MRQRSKVALATGVGLVVVAAVIVAAATWRRRPGAKLMTVPGRPATLAVVPFRTGTPAPRSWAATVFAESLAARLARIPGLEPHVSTGGAGSSDFVLRGEVSAKDGRLVVATRLIDQSNGETVWTATFWRTDAPNPNLAGELAADVAEALYGHLARRAVTATEGKP